MEIIDIIFSDCVCASVCVHMCTHFDKFIDAHQAHINGEKGKMQNYLFGIKLCQMIKFHKSGHLK